MFIEDLYRVRLEIVESEQRIDDRAYECVTRGASQTTKATWTAVTNQESLHLSIVATRVNQGLGQLHIGLQLELPDKRRVD